MGYFSNGTEGMIYEEMFCYRCAHYQDGMCPVLTVHAVYNYDACGDDARAVALKSILDRLIPRDSTGLNDCCTMFTENR
jgi:hypothetical protein